MVISIRRRTGLGIELNEEIIDKRHAPESTQLWCSEEARVPRAIHKTQSICLYPALPIGAFWLFHATTADAGRKRHLDRSEVMLGWQAHHSRNGTEDGSVSGASWKEVVSRDFGHK
jgi:hypothetical protein